MDPKTTDPVIIDLLHWLKENLPDDASEEYIIKKVHRLQKVFDTLMSLSVEGFYNLAISQRQTQKNDCQTPTESTPPPPMTFEEMVDQKIREMQEYLTLDEDKQLKTKKLEASTAKLDLERHQYELITSIKLDSCMDLISRYNRLMSKK